MKINAPEVVTHAEVEVYLTLAGTYRAYVRGLSVDNWAAFRSTAIRGLINNLIAKEIPFDFSEAPPSFWKD